MIQRIKRLSRQSEKVGQRRIIGYRPENEVYKRLTKMSIKEGISMNQIVDGIIKKEVNMLA